MIDDKKVRLDNGLDDSNIDVKGMAQAYQSTQREDDDNEDIDLSKIMSKHLGNDNVNEEETAGAGEKEPLISADTINIGLELSDITESDFEKENNDTVIEIDNETTWKGKFEKMQKLMTTKDVQIESLRAIVKQREKVIEEQNKDQYPVDRQKLIYQV